MPFPHCMREGQRPKTNIRELEAEAEAKTCKPVFFDEAVARNLCFDGSYGRKVIVETISKVCFQVADIDLWNGRHGTTS